MFSKKATKIDEIFIVDLTVTTYCCQIGGEDFVNFCGFLENVNFTYSILQNSSWWYGIYVVSFLTLVLCTWIDLAWPVSTWLDPP